MSDSVRAHRQQPTRLPRPWDSPGKNAGVGYHFLLQCVNLVQRFSYNYQFDIFNQEYFNGKSPIN